MMPSSGKSDDVAVGDLLEDPNDLRGVRRGLATAVRVEAQVMRTKPNRFMESSLADAPPNADLPW